MKKQTAVRPARKRPDRYHHGDLRRALLQQTLRTIEAEGVDAVTLRGVGQALGVSRTALYRHFADKGALLSAVASEGFRMLRLALVDAWDGHGRGFEGFAAMGQAYVKFAVQHPSHYRVMFSGFVDSGPPDRELKTEASGAFQALVDALVWLQQAGLVRQDEPLLLAQFIWSLVHGIARLVIDGLVRGPLGDPDVLTRFAIERARTGIAEPQRSPSAQSAPSSTGI
jgi:AcrR family transcriptional regulator